MNPEGVRALQVQKLKDPLFGGLLFFCALGGTRTPNLLIRRNLKARQLRFLLASYRTCSAYFGDRQEQR